MEEKETRRLFELERILLEDEQIKDIELSPIEKECIRLMAANHSMEPSIFLKSASWIKF